MSGDVLSWLVTGVVLPGAAYVVKELLPVGVEWIKASITQKDASRAAGAFTAGAGRVLIDVMEAKQKDPSADLGQVAAAGARREAEAIVGSIMSETAAKLGVSVDDAEKAVLGRVGSALGDVIGRAVK